MCGGGWGGGYTRVPWAHAYHTETPRGGRALPTEAGLEAPSRHGPSPVRGPPYPPPREDRDSETALTRRDDPCKKTAEKALRFDCSVYKTAAFSGHENASF